MAPVNSHPSDELYRQLQLAYDHFNEALFDSSLPKCFFTLRRGGSSIGMFWNTRWWNQKGVGAHEIAFNPSLFANHTLADILQALAREQCNIWQREYGKPGRRGYCNVEWADKMESLGLIPSDTGKPGGKRVGQRVSHYLIENSKLDRACLSLLEKGFDIPWIDRNFTTAEWLIEPSEDNPKKPRNPRKFLNSTVKSRFVALTHYSGTSSKTRNKVKYSCVSCDSNIWGKPGLAIWCRRCDKAFRVTRPVQSGPKGTDNIAAKNRSR